jgi:hypothetical protein
MVQLPMHIPARLPAHPADTCEIISGPRRVARDTAKAIDVTRGGKLAVWLSTIAGAGIWSGLTPTGEHNAMTLGSFAVAGSLGGALIGVLLIAGFVLLTPWKLTLHWAGDSQKTGLTQGWVPHTRLILMSNCQHRVRDLTCTVTSLEGVVYTAKPPLGSNGSVLLARGQRVLVGYPTDFEGANRSETDNPASDEYQVVWTSLTKNGGGPVVIYKTKWIVERDPTP